MAAVQFFRLALADLLLCHILKRVLGIAASLISHTSRLAVLQHDDLALYVFSSTCLAELYCHLCRLLLILFVNFLASLLCLGPSW